MPFVTEEIYRRLVSDLDTKAPESVHLTDYPVLQKLTKQDSKLINDMTKIREIASLGQAARIEAHIKLRQPLSELKVYGATLKKWEKELLQEELNVKKLTPVKKLTKKKGWQIQKLHDLKVALNIELSEKLKQEGLLRELSRVIQDTRKKEGFNQEDLVEVTIETKSDEIKEILEVYKKELKSQTNSSKISLGKGKKTMKVNGEEIKISVQI
jgi:isoleucyl-tRNA synthetase